MKTLQLLTVDSYGTVVNTVENAECLRQLLKKNGCVSIPLALGNDTMYHITFAYLFHTIPSVGVLDRTQKLENPVLMNLLYQDGSGRGLMIAIDRLGSYALPLEENKEKKLHPSYLAEKLHIGSSDAEALAPFIDVLRRQ